MRVFDKAISSRSVFIDQCVIVCAVALGVFGFVSKYLYDRWEAAKQED